MYSQSTNRVHTKNRPAQQRGDQKEASTQMREERVEWLCACVLVCFCLACPKSPPRGIMHGPDVCDSYPSSQQRATLIASVCVRSRKSTRAVDSTASTGRRRLFTYQSRPYTADWIASKPIRHPLGPSMLSESMDHTIPCWRSRHHSDIVRLSCPCARPAAQQPICKTLSDRISLSHTHFCQTTTLHPPTGGAGAAVCAPGGFWRLDRDETRTTYLQA